MGLADLSQNAYVLQRTTHAAEENFSGSPIMCSVNEHTHRVPRGCYVYVHHLSSSLSWIATRIIHTQRREANPYNLQQSFKRMRAADKLVILLATH